jgi:hypothetical protein
MFKYFLVHIYLHARKLEKKSQISGAKTIARVVLAKLFPEIPKASCILPHARRRHICQKLTSVVSAQPLPRMALPKIQRHNFSPNLAHF